MPPRIRSRRKLKSSHSPKTRSRIGFNLDPLSIGYYTLIVEFFPPETTDFSVTALATAISINSQTTNKNPHPVSQMEQHTTTIHLPRFAWDSSSINYRKNDRLRCSSSRFKREPESLWHALCCRKQSYGNANWLEFEWTPIVRFISLCLRCNNYGEWPNFKFNGSDKIMLPNNSEFRVLQGYFEVSFGSKVILRFRHSRFQATSTSMILGTNQLWSIMRILLR